ncbi:MAG: alpha/beta hydrolase [Chloroflexi bacterium]|nr:alpha/beta hydrolase [Chloroflexota bacterium]
MSFVNNQGIRIHYQVEGAGPPLVLYHGLTENGDLWRLYGYVELLGRDYQVILMDARGHGQSDKPHDPAQQGYELMAADVVAVLDDLSVAQAHYWGYSLGGRVGYSLARLAPQRFRSFVIGGCPPSARRSDPSAESAGFYETMLAALAGGMEPYVARLERRQGPLPPHRRERLLHTDVQALIAAVAAQRDSPVVEDVPETMTMPTLLYAGDADFTYPGVQAGAPRFPNSRFVALPGLNHETAHERSDLALPPVMAFLAEVENATSPAYAQSR